eukprot:GHVT01082512.1.p1 GENE.GHVT01082512.1~~GHVT01082512.1.p1  ORF type:complete len:1288 (-),score=358.80 GHVT01082512.1:657-4220(-)
MVQAGYDPHPLFMDRAGLRGCDQYVDECPPQVRQLAMMGMVEQMLLAGAFAAPLAKEKTVERIIKRLQLEDEEKKLSDEERGELAAALARLLKAAAEAENVKEIERVKGFDAVLKAIEEYPENPRVIVDVSRCLAAMAAVDDNLMARSLREALPKLTTDCTATIQTDPEAADAFMDLALTLVAVEGNGRHMLHQVGLEETLQGIENLAAFYGEEFGEMMQQKVASLRQAMVDDEPREKNCQDVFKLLAKRQAAGHSNVIADVAILQDEVEFLFTQLSVYNDEKLDSETAAGADHQYGNMAFEILGDHAENVKPLFEQDFAKMQLATAKLQKDEEIALYACRAITKICRHPQGAQEVARTPGGPVIVTELLKRLMKSSALEDASLEEHACVRVLLVERTAINRNVYNKTEVMPLLVELWDDYEKHRFSSNLARHVFRAIRRVVSDAHVDVLLRANVLERLIAIVNDAKADLAVLPDVLFLMGSLAVIPEIKTKIGTIGGIEAVVKLMNRQLANDEALPVITNSCLALANICIGHKKNNATFIKVKGPEITVAVLNARAGALDVVNAASVLVCNLLYKNEENKILFGQNGTPAALVKALGSYDGSEEKTSLRGLESMFKAISNLSLYTHNVPAFLNANIETSYCQWLENLSETFPDSVMETGCRTLANLTAEYDEKNMVKFGVVMSPVLNCLSQGRQDTKLLYLLLDIVSCLIRAPANSQAFVENDGIEAVVKLVHRFDYDLNLLALAVHVLGTQALNPAATQKLLAADVFSILVGCVDVDATGSDVTDLVVGGLRCTRRMISSREMALEYCTAGGVATIANVICKSVAQPMVMLEALRVLLCLFARVDPTPEQRAAAQAASTDESNAGLAADEDAADNPNEALFGAWYHIGMEAVMISAVLQAICSCAVTAAFVTQLRLQRAALSVVAYLVAEGQGTESFVGSGGDQMLLNNITKFPGEATIMQLTCCIVANVALTSGDLFESLKAAGLVEALGQAFAKIPVKKPEGKLLADACKPAVDAIKTTGDCTEAFASVPRTFDFGWSQWDRDPYPNGVQDLSTEAKEWLRAGHRFKVYTAADKDKNDVKFRASLDLNSFEWQIGEGTTEYSNRMAIVRIKAVHKGLAHPLLKEANKAAPRKVPASVCFVVTGPATEDVPTGLELPMRCKNQKERDEALDMLMMWRDAASYNA